MRFLHTADWQIGLRAESVGRRAERVREERFAAAKRVVRAGIDRGAQMLLLTGDVFEDNAVDRLLIRKVGEILRQFPGPVFIIPGNHDPLGPGSVWTHPIWQETGNITVFTASEPRELDSCVLFPCPLHEKYSSKDPTAWIQAQTATKPAIGLAHGNVEGIPSGEPDYPIPRDAARRRSLDYLALGHWHSYARYEEADGACRMAYSGTHETTKFGERDSGHALLVEITERGAPPVITPVRTGGLHWRTYERSIDLPGLVEPLLQELAEVADPETALVRVDLEGLLHPQDRDALKRLEEVVATRFLFGSLDTSRLFPAPEGDGWIEVLPPGPLRAAAQKLRAQASSAPDVEQRATATEALLQLFDLLERSRR